MVGPGCQNLAQVCMHGVSLGGSKLQCTQSWFEESLQQSCGQTFLVDLEQCLTVVSGSRYLGLVATGVLHRCIWTSLHTMLSVGVQGSCACLMCYTPPRRAVILAQTTGVSLFHPGLTGMLWRIQSFEGTPIRQTYNGEYMFLHRVSGNTPTGVYWVR